MSFQIKPSLSNFIRYFTFEEVKGSISKKTISWVGDGNNNMSNSLIEAAGKFGFTLKIGSPKICTR